MGDGCREGGWEGGEKGREMEERGRGREEGHRLRYGQLDTLYSDVLSVHSKVVTTPLPHSSC